VEGSRHAQNQLDSSSQFNRTLVTDRQTDTEPWLECVNRGRNVDRGCDGAPRPAEEGTLLMVDIQLGLSLICPALDMLKVTRDYSTGKQSTAVRNTPHQSPLRELTCQLRSHSVTCHPAEVTFPPLPQQGRSTRLSDPGRMPG